MLEIVHDRYAMTADTTLRLGRYFGVEPQLWLNPQTRHGVDRAADALATGWRGPSKMLAMERC